MDILLLRIDKLGDFVLSIKPILKLKKLYPDSNIDIIINNSNYPIAKSLSIFRKIMVIHTNLSAIRNLFSITKMTKRKEYDYSIDLIYGTNHLSSVLQLFISAKNKIGVPVGLRKYFLTEKVNVTKLKYETELVSDILQKLFNKKNESISFPEITLNGKSQEIQRIYKLERRKYICIYPIIDQLERKRQWSRDRYAELIGQLLQGFPHIQVVLTGTADDSLYISKIMKKINNKRVINLAGKIGLLELVSLLDGCLFSLGGLTGPSHISAVISKRPTFCIVGGTTMTRWVSPDYGYIVIKKSPSCFPCEHLKGCRNKEKYKCLNDLPVEYVLAAIQKNVL